MALPLGLHAQYTFTTNNGAITITGYTGSGGEVTIPETINSLAVTGVGSFAFASCTGLTSVVIGGNVTNIGMAAFYHCTGLSRATISNRVTGIGEFAFQQCSNLNQILLPDRLTAITYAMFQGCTCLRSVTVPQNVTFIGDYAFDGCTNLTALYFKGNPPSLDCSVLEPCSIFPWQAHPIIYYLPGTTGWGPSLSNYPTTVLWNPVAQTDGGNFGVQSNAFGFNMSGSSNLVIVVEACPNLLNDTWTSIGTNTLDSFIGTNGTSHFGDPQWTNYPVRFYRLRSP